MTIRGSVADLSADPDDMKMEQPVATFLHDEKRRQTTFKHESPFFSAPARQDGDSKRPASSPDAGSYGQVPLGGWKWMEEEIDRWLRERTVVQTASICTSERALKGAHS